MLAAGLHGSSGGSWNWWVAELFLAHLLAMGLCATGFWKQDQVHQGGTFACSTEFSKQRRVRQPLLSHEHLTKGTQLSLRKLVMKSPVTLGSYPPVISLALVSRVAIGPV